MDEDSPGKPPRRAIAQTGKRIALHLNWNLVFSIFILYVLLSFFDSWRAGRHHNPWVLLATIVTPFNHVFAVTMVAPMPWLLWRHRSRFWTFLQGLFLSLLACEAAGVTIVLLEGWFSTRAGYPPEHMSRLLMAYTSVVAPAMMVLGGLLAARALAVGENESIREEAMIAKTRLLQSQLHPHVLFNALNGLAELIHKDPPAAERSVGHLADLLRRILRASEQPTFPLGEERALVEDYLHLEGMRLGPRLTVEWEWDSALNGVPVPPLLIQPLVENAIKHGIAPSREGGTIRILARRQGADLCLEVWNTGAPFQQGKEAGIGLRNLASRVALVYGAEARFSIQTQGNWTQATVLLAGTLVEYVHDSFKSPRCG